MVTCSNSPKVEYTAARRPFGSSSTDMRLLSVGAGFDCVCGFMFAQLCHHTLRALFQIRSSFSPVTVIHLRKRLLTLCRTSVTMFAP